MYTKLPMLYRSSARLSALTARAPSQLLSKLPCRRCMGTAQPVAAQPEMNADEDAVSSIIFSRVSPMDPASNIKLIEYTLAPDASPARRKIEARRVRAQKEWIRFWSLHNRDYAVKFNALKAAYPPKGDVPPEKMTQFFQEHMAVTQADHRRFNAWWLSENFGLLGASVRCWLTDRITERKEPGFFGSH